MKNLIQLLLLLSLVGFLGILACNRNSDDSGLGLGDDNPPISEELPAMYNQFSEDVEISLDGNFVVIKSSGVPNHSSPYFEETDSRYEAYNGTNANFNLNPNRIEDQNFEFRIPVNPIEAEPKESTRLGAIGIAINGIPFFNQYAGPNNEPLTNEINSFDQHNGHPQNAGIYHYHIEPTFLTSEHGNDVFLGVLLDGFPVYGPIENGAAITNDVLDEYHGHFGPTAEYPDGIYHYHITGQDPYLNGDGYFGVPGTVSN